MKRSKMLELLMNHFNRYDNGKNIAEIALSCVENNGMLPPFSHQMFEKNWNKHRDPVSAHGNEWEPEDAS